MLKKHFEQLGVKVLVALMTPADPGQRGPAHQPYSHPAAAAAPGKCKGFSCVIKPVGPAASRLCPSAVHALMFSTESKLSIAEKWLPKSPPFSFIRERRFRLPEWPISAPDLRQGLRARLSSRDLAKEAVGLGCRPGTDRSDLQVHRCPRDRSQLERQEPGGMAMAPHFYVNHTLVPKRSWPQHEPHLSQGYLAHAKVKNTGELRVRQCEG